MYWSMWDTDTCKLCIIMVDLWPWAVMFTGLGNVCGDEGVIETWLQQRGGDYVDED